MKRAAVSGRRVWAYLDRQGQASCVIWRVSAGRRIDQWTLQRAVRAFDMNCFRRPPAIGHRIGRDGNFTLEWERASAVARLVTGDVVYAFYCRGSNCLKIGRTSDLLRRWTKLEHESGQLRQWISVWNCPDSRQFEHELHRRWLAHRTIGEWFAADPVLSDLREIYSAAARPAC